MANKEEFKMSDSLKLIYSCSGFADVGEISDRVTRRLSRNGFAKMFCLVGIGAEIQDFIDKANNADQNIAIDGCSLACAKKCLELKGITSQSYIITDMGFEKGSTPPSEENIDKVFNKLKSSF